MKKIFSVLVMALLVMSVMPMVIGEGTETEEGISIGIKDDCLEPEIHWDFTSTAWNPNDQTKKTALIYGEKNTNRYLYEFYALSRGADYAFTGESVAYFVVVEDPNGEDDIDAVKIKWGADENPCVEIDPIDLGVWTDGETLSYLGGILYDDATMNTYQCKVVAQAGWSGQQDIDIEATDVCGPNTDTITVSSTLDMNPTYSLTLSGTFNFGTSIRPGTTVTSSPVKLTSPAGAGVVMDTYIAADTYFTDPGNPNAVCPDANGLRYDNFLYKATKGGTSSAWNTNAYPGLGDDTDGACDARYDEATPMPSYSGDIEDMCRIINHEKEGSFLTQGGSMDIFVVLDVPSPCDGAFTDGKMHVVGRVV